MKEERKSKANTPSDEQLKTMRCMLVKRKEIGAEEEKGRKAKCKAEECDQKAGRQCKAQRRRDHCREIANDCLLKGHWQPPENEEQRLDVAWKTIQRLVLDVKKTEKDMKDYEKKRENSIDEQEAIKKMANIIMILKEESAKKERTTKNLMKRVDRIEDERQEEKMMRGCRKEMRSEEQCKEERKQKKEEQGMRQEMGQGRRIEALMHGKEIAEKESREEVKEKENERNSKRDEDKKRKQVMKKMK